MRPQTLIKVGQEHKFCIRSFSSKQPKYCLDYLKERETHSFKKVSIIFKPNIMKAFQVLTLTFVFLKFCK